MRGDATAAQNCVQVRVKVLKKMVESGISTTIPRYASVKPRVRLNPGSTLVRLIGAAKEFPRFLTGRGSTSRLVDLVEYPAVAEEFWLHAFPSAEISINSD